jgi:hypothetical protein
MAQLERGSVIEKGAMLRLAEQIVRLPELVRIARALIRLRHNADSG